LRRIAACRFTSISNVHSRIPPTGSYFPWTEAQSIGCNSFHRRDGRRRTPREAPMSFRWFIYLCALCGGWAALVGWGFGRAWSSESRVAEAGVKGMLLGLLVALGVGLVDALWNLSLMRPVQVLLRVMVSVLVGCFGGLIGGTIGQVLFGLTDLSAFVIVGWAITGLLIGASVGAFEVLTSLASGQNLRGAVRKVINGVCGGALGGLLGGVFLVLLRGVWGVLFRETPLEQLWSPSAIGFVVLGMCIGLLIGLAQVILKEAWVKVEAGFRAGRELMLTKNETVIGRAEGCDIGLFGAQGVERQHCRIVQREDSYYLCDDNSPGGTYENDRRSGEPVALRSGDRIRLGSCVLRFGERQKR
jgi:hypothetical protein